MVYQVCKKHRVFLKRILALVHILQHCLISSNAPSCFILHLNFNSRQAICLTSIYSSQKLLQPFLQNAKSHLPLNNLHQFLWDWRAFYRSIFNKVVSGESSFSCRRENPIIVACSVTGSTVYLRQVVRCKCLTSPAIMTEHKESKERNVNAFYHCLLGSPSYY